MKLKIREKEPEEEEVEIWLEEEGGNIHVMSSINCDFPLFECEFKSDGKMEIAWNGHFEVENATAVE